ncbi:MULTISPECIES: hydroxyphenylacetyl-CoA thioesterase PaaI [unclassified Sphingobium]|uniref:hydroxyphenylacetyl-CoA thioesterase PaaI n=1 Tax=unclassified Sphingobium TaxID=2611147 RepID=UPI000D1599CD|nr:MULTISPECIES: hydroxyphenylacetyl-CoA thioesterase PaaI [unclassified Sphingobium]MBG6120421.1 acyl-CoA thioesterase [Sphingobium sp. JAI105]PSO10019.1 phenylacetic acid degradation protein PaaD [Sphingobium sp. AEW4]TWC98913.1 acyl-CoA thioesterase [Sphingobium sp. AEW010]TWD18392.1 acyl-CoA thioesterase [Sphingobium sp. AEW013]TWD21020.1 acyl-CoA thioesterase [Sphingobium sp. AEW001]
MTDDRAREIALAMMAREGIAKALGIELEEARIGYARIRMTVRADMLNGYGTAHGGIIFTIADSAFAYACNSRDVATVAQGASISFLAGPRENEILVAEASEIMIAGRSGSYSVVVTTSDGRDIATFHGLSRSIGGSALHHEA